MDCARLDHFDAFLDEVRMALRVGPLSWSDAVGIGLRRGVGPEDARRLLLDLASGRDYHIMRGPAGAPALCRGEL